jgi:hypothetical protein
MSFKEQWNEYRKRRNLLLFAVLGFLLVLPLADYLGHRVLQSEAVFASLAIGWGDGFFRRERNSTHLLALSQMRRLVRCNVVVSQSARQMVR